MTPPARNLRSTEKSDESSAPTTCQLTELPEDTPAWGIALYELLNNVITTSHKEVNQQISDLINISVKNAQDKAQEAHELAEHNRTIIETLSDKINRLSDMVECLREQNTKQQRHILKNETYSRRDNLLFRGFNASDEPCEVIVRRILSKMGLQGVDHIPFVRCHYLEGKNQIIVRFQSYTDREKVWRNRFSLKSTGHNQFYVSEDFPASIAADRKQLYPVFKAAKTLPEFHRKVTIIDNRLKLNDKFYTTDTLHTVPASINPASLAERISDEFYVFGGTTSRFCKHSNFFKREFVYDHIQYESVEQAFQHRKAREAKDMNKCREIMFNADPSTQKYLGQRVSGLDIADWNTRKFMFMKEILLAKYTQHQDLQDALLGTGTRTIAEANGRDDVFAIGLPITHKDVMSPAAWRGQNHLGKLLMEVREELSR